MKAKYSPYSKTFCALPWVHLATNTNGAARLCCVAEDVLKTEQGSPQYLNEVPIAKIWNSPEMRETRRKMLAGEEVEACRGCYKEEKYGNFSTRISSNTKWLEILEAKNDTRIFNSTDNQHVVKPGPLYFDLRQGNICNLKCRMCIPSYSAAIESEIKAHRETDTWFAHQHDLHAPFLKNMNWSEDPNFLAQISEVLPGIETIYFAGGEPTLVKNNFKLMQKCIETGVAGQIELMFSTNATFITKEFIDLISQFRNVCLNLSIDGFGVEQEYIRSNSKWTQIEKSLHLLAESELPRVSMIATPVIQAANALTIDRLFYYLDSLNEKYQKNCFTLLPLILHSPIYMDIAILPHEIRQEAKNRIQNYMKTTNTLHDPFFEGRMQNVLHFLDKHYVENTHELLSDFVSVNRRYDKIRKQSLTGAFPELSQWLKKTNPELEYL